MLSLPERPLEYEPGYRNQKYLAFFCCGYPGKRPPEHTYEICERMVGNILVVIDYTPLKLALHNLGKQNVFVSQSSSRCPVCALFMHIELQQKTLAKITEKHRRDRKTFRG